VSKPLNKWWGVPIGFGSGLVFGVLGAVGATGLMAVSKKTRGAAVVTGVSSVAGAVAAWVGIFSLSAWLTKRAVTQAVQEQATQTVPAPASQPALQTDPLVQESVTKELSGFPYAGLMTPVIDKWRGKNSVLLGRGIRII
jgi:hypothetical protein